MAGRDLLASKQIKLLVWARHTGVGSASGATGGVIDAVGLLSALGVEVCLSLLGDGDGVLTLVCGRHYDRSGGWVGKVFVVFGCMVS